MIDDSGLVQNLLSRILAEAGHQIVGRAMDGESGIQFYQSNQDQIDLVTLDITLPRMNGIDVLKEIWAINSDARVIMVSSEGTAPVVKSCLEVGAKDFITKPFTKEKVLAKVANIL